VNKPALLLCASLALPARADEGMWTFDAFPSAAVERAHGFRPDAAWLDQVRLATVRLAGGCSGSFVSGSGLVMTNQHCVRDCVAAHTSATHDRSRDGFVAATAGDELRCPTLEVHQLLSIADVTARLEKATAGLDGKAHADALAAETARVERECATSPSLRCEVVSLYRGGLRHLYAFRRFADVRLAFSPELAAAHFGGDPDNFDFPRFALDAALVRVWEDGKPARTPDFFPWSAKGPAEGELTFVPGNPGRTSRLLTVAQLAYQRDVFLPEALADLSELRGMLAEFRRRGPAQARDAEPRLLEVENFVKVARGRIDALRDPAFWAAKVATEARLRATLAADPERADRALPAFDAIARARGAARDLRVAYRYLEVAPVLGSKAGYDERTSVTSGELVAMARTLLRTAVERPRPDGERLKELRDAALPALEKRLFSTAPIHPELEILELSHWLERLRELRGVDDPAVRQLLGRESPLGVATRVVRGTKVGDPAFRRAVWQGGLAAVEDSTDPAIAFARALDPFSRAARTRWEARVAGPEQRADAVLAKARFEAQGTSGYPDATFTPRLSFGKVRGFLKSGRAVPPFTTLAGAFDRHTGEDPFALPPRVLAARGRLDLATPFNLVTTNDIIGGNSGSAMINRDREVVGLVFDGNLPSLGGDYAFDEEGGNRCVAVHSSGLLELLRKAYRAERLADELRGR